MSGFQINQIDLVLACSGVLCWLQQETPLLLSSTASSSVPGLALTHSLMGGLTQKAEVHVNFQLGCHTSLINRPCSGSGGFPGKDLCKGDSW